MRDQATVEQARLDALDRYDLLDTPQEESFDRITRLARRLFDVPVATITLVDGHRTWCKSVHGDLPVTEIPRKQSFCDATIAGSDPLVVLDTLMDARFSKHPIVLSEPGFRFYAGAPLSTPDGQSLGALCILDYKPRTFGVAQVEVLTELAQIVMSELELRNLATTDGLTGAMSRRSFKKEAERLLALAIRHRYDLSCIAFDLDHFKSINDTHGHGWGDRVLKESVDRCRASVRKTDLVGRMGGEEFTILLPFTSATAALEVAEKIRAALQQAQIMGPSGPIRISASFGVASVSRFASDLELLLECADRALYQAKAQGRNRCVIWQPAETISPTQLRRVFKAGRIAFKGGQASIDCTVRRLSETGAVLDVVSTADVPSVFKLRVDADDHSQTCRVVVKRDKHLEVQFTY